jgi:polyisoprenoid-binding protein YceI
MTTIANDTQTLPAGDWQADAAHSRVEFSLEYMGGTFRGSFSPFEARLEVDEDGQATLTGLARAENVRVQDENLEAHLLSPEFFDAERTPELRFQANDLRREGETIEASGELTVRGQSSPVELRGTIRGPLTDPYGRERIGVTFETTVDRTAFRLNWNAPLADGAPALANDVKLSAELYLVEA